jgi:pimeloyl-ACP methyl ester carboxylesterase
MLRMRLVVDEGDDMNSVLSKDGTRIAYDKLGEGPAVILVAGALCARLSWAGPELARLLSLRYTVYNYDRRGRGDSSDTSPYAVEREVEDIQALIDDAGGSAYVYGHSSGAALALEAAARLGDAVKKLALYEAPYNDDPQAQAAWREYIRQLSRLLAENRRGDAVALFMKYVSTPDDQIEEARQAPFWQALEAIAPTLAYDHTAILGEANAIPTARAGRVNAPTLVMSGGDSFPFIKVTAQALSQAIPHAKLRMVPGQTHAVESDVLAPVLLEFFAR